jgi:hypothetical protein
MCIWDPSVLLSVPKRKEKEEAEYLIIQFQALKRINRDSCWLAVAHGESKGKEKRFILLDSRSPRYKYAYLSCISE